MQSRHHQQAMTWPEGAELDQGRAGNQHRRPESARPPVRQRIAAGSHTDRRIRYHGSQPGSGRSASCFCTSATPLPRSRPSRRAVTATMGCWFSRVNCAAPGFSVNRATWRRRTARSGTLPGAARSRSGSACGSSISVGRQACTRTSTLCSPSWLQSLPTTRLGWLLWPRPSPPGWTSPNLERSLAIHSDHRLGRFPQCRRSRPPRL